MEKEIKNNDSVLKKNDIFDNRELDIIEMRREKGMTFQDIGVRFGISRERIRKIYNKIEEKEDNIR